MEVRSGAIERQTCALSKVARATKDRKPAAMKQIAPAPSVTYSEDRSLKKATTSPNKKTSSIAQTCKRLQIRKAGVSQDGRRPSRTANSTAVMVPNRSSGNANTNKKTVSASKGEPSRQTTET